MADIEAAARAARAEDQKLLAESRAEYNERMKGHPTPTQEECDLAKLGASLTKKEDDGSGPDPFQVRVVEARPASSGYTTRQVRASTASSPRRETPPTPSSSS